MCDSFCEKYTVDGCPESWYLFVNFQTAGFKIANAKITFNISDFSVVRLLTNVVRIRVDIFGSEQ